MPHATDTDRPAVAHCVVCEATGLRPRHRVAAEAGAEGLIPTTDRYGSALADIVACPSCGHMQLGVFPAAPLLESAYGAAESGDYVEEERGQRATAARTLERVERHHPPGKLLDIGCWVGFLLAEARDRGWSGVGLEPSGFASAYAREQLDLDVRTEFLETVPRSGDFGAVVMGDVIEHLVDPGAALALVRGALEPKGVLVLTLPDAGSRIARLLGRRWWSVLPTHVQYFTRGSISRLLEEHGFEVLEVATAPKAFTVRYYLGRLRGYSPPLSAALVAVAERLGLADRLWAPDFRDRMLVLARPRA